MSVRLANLLADYGLGVVVFVGVFLGVLYLVKRKAEKRNSEYLEHQQHGMEKISATLERVSELLKQNDSKNSKQ